MRSRLYINHIESLNWFIALEFGRVDEGQAPDHWVGVSEQFGYLYEQAGSEARCLGFKVLNYSTFDTEDEAVEQIWTGPHFDAPALGLTDVSAGAIIVAARALLGDAVNVGRELFEQATAETGDDALRLWLQCLQAGDSMAHFGLGYTLFELGRYPEAYRHLRHYSEIAPYLAWSVCWYGRAAAAVGELDEAREALERATELEGLRGEETDAAELLALLDAGDIEAMLRVNAGEARGEVISLPDPFPFFDSEPTVESLPEEPDGRASEFTAALDEICLRVHQALKPWTVPQLPDAERDPRIALRVTRDYANALLLVLRIAYKATRPGIEPDVGWEEYRAELEAIARSSERARGGPFAIGDIVEFVGYPTLIDPPNAGVRGPIISVGHPEISPSENEHWENWVVVDFPPPLGRYTAHINEIQRASDAEAELETWESSDWTSDEDDVDDRTVFELMGAVVTEMVDALGVSRDSWGEYAWNELDDEQPLSRFVRAMALLLIRGLHFASPANMVPSDYVFLDMVPRELRNLAGVPWMDWTPMPPTRVDMMLAQLGEAPEDPAARAAWEMRRDVIRDFALDLISLDLPGIDLAWLVDDPEAAVADHESERGDWWGSGLLSHPSVRNLLAEHLASSG